jgi:protocatechuate 3,4-dioxygenase beta subunit
MRDLTEANVTDAVLAKLAGMEDERARFVLSCLIRHLHAFARETELTPEEWMKGVEFLTAVGQITDETRQEFIILSDTLGLSILVDAMNNRKPKGATESTVLGPFYRKGARDVANGEAIAELGKWGEPVVVQGRVTTPAGEAIAGAALDIWQTDGQGMYENQDPSQPDMNLRARVTTDADGRYCFKTVKPKAYSIPADGPVGRMLAAMGRHPYRPAHIHLIVSAKGFQPVVTQLFDEADPYIDSDAVFAVKASLAVPFKCSDDEAAARRWGVAAPFYTVDYDFGLAPA